MAEILKEEMERIGIQATIHKTAFFINVTSLPSLIRIFSDWQLIFRFTLSTSSGLFSVDTQSSL